MMPPDTPFPWLKKAWSPAVHDPRFSRGQVDAQIARIRAAKAARGVSGDGSRWASYIIGEKARKLHKYDSRRCDLLARLEKMADAAEAAPIPAALQVSQSSPALRKVVGAQQTVSLQPRQHSVLGGEGIVIAAPAFCE
jgi:hypothetical protein